MSDASPDKRRLVAGLRARIEEDLATVERRRADTAAGATHEENRAEHAKDTRATEDSYLARGLAERVAALLALCGRRPRLPLDVPPMVDELVQSCWCDQPRARLTFTSVQQQLQRLRDGLTAEELDRLDTPEGHATPRLPDEGA